MSTTPNLRLAVPFFMVRDMETSLKFYTEQLGFTITNQWTPRGKIEWCWLGREGVALMLQEYRDTAKFESFPKVMAYPYASSAWMRWRFIMNSAQKAL